MLKSTNGVPPLLVPKETLLAAAERFLRRLSGENVLMPVKNVASPESGGSDLAFIKRGRKGLTIVRLHQQGNFAEFFLQTVAYRCWLKECLKLSETILCRAIGLDVYLMTYDLPPIGGYLWKAISEFSELSLVKYRLLNIEARPEPLVRFELLNSSLSGEKGTAEGPNDDKMPMAGAKPRKSTDPDLSSAEIDEFNRLRARHL